jgi:hypothetical protein
MKLIITLALLWTSTFSHAALFDFATGAAANGTSGQSSTWAVDLATARQWYIAWAASADRVYQRMINPGASVVSDPIHRITTKTLLSQAVFVGVSGLLTAALISAAKSISKVLLISRRQLAASAN